MKSTKLALLCILCMGFSFLGGGRIKLNATTFSVFLNKDIFNVLGNHTDLVSHAEFDFSRVALHRERINNSFSPPDSIVLPSNIFSLGESLAMDTVLTDSWTVSCVDYNGDGYDDVFFTERNSSKPCYLFKNNQGSGFSRMTSGPLVTDRGITMSSTWADFDNDGDIDPLIVNNSQQPNYFYINDGAGNFSRDLTKSFAALNAYFQNASFIDYDNDGLIDVFIANYLPTRFHELWHNEGNGVFVKDESITINQSTNKAVGATWADYDSDGLLDLFIPGSGGTSNLLFHNNGAGNFDRVMNSPVSTAGGFAVGSCWGDIDNDGDLDLFIANNGNKNNCLFINNGGQFTQRTSGIEVNNQGQSHGCSFVDIDNDADLDLYVTNDEGVKFLYFNDGSGNFIRNNTELITQNFGKSFGHAWTDVDRDGDLDLFVATHSNNRNYHFINNSSSNHWIAFRLIGSRSNKSAIGARIKIKSGNTWQTREINSQSGFGGQSTLNVHFGLGSSSIIDTIIVQWPSGYIQTLYNSPINRYKTIREPQTAIITGQLFADLNGNCLKDSLEPFVPNFLISVNNYESQTLSGSDGRFEIPVLPGIRIAHIHENELYELNCDSLFFAIIMNTNVIRNIGLIAVQPRCTNSDLSVIGYTTALRRGFGNHYYIKVRNNGSIQSSATQLSVNFPSVISVISSTPQWYQNQVQTGIAGNYIYSIPELSPGQEFQIIVNDSVNLSASIGQTISILTKIVSVSGDCNATNNNYADLQQIVGAIDPNDLLAFPIGISERKYIQKDQVITYRIRFQNIGNYSAHSVTIEDVLPKNLDMSKIAGFKFSHPANFYIRDEKLIIFFNGIELPDSSSDLEGSQGFVEFTIPISEDATAGSIITNKASIVFDYEDAIVTNETNHTIIDSNNPELIDLKVFPNPATSEFFIVNPFEGPVNVKITSLGGLFIKTFSSSDSIIQFDSANLSTGFYIIELILNNEIIRTGKIVIIK
jgi:uncharacterized repeat protein (TIGR01451 family)